MYIYLLLKTCNQLDIFTLSVINLFNVSSFILQVVEESFFKPPAPLWRHVLITSLLLGGSVGATYATPCLSILLELNVSLEITKYHDAIGYHRE